MENSKLERINELARLAKERALTAEELAERDVLALYRQGHHVFPYALLAGSAQDCRVQPADKRSHSRLLNRQRRKDVEVQGNVRFRPSVFESP